MRRSLILILAAALALPMAASASTPKPSWRCIAGVCLGQSRGAITYKYGVVVDQLPSRGIRVPGGRVWACFWRCQGSVTEDGFTYYGGTMRPANRLLTISTCDSIFLLPDGTTLGTNIPFGKLWNGYRRIVLYEPGPRAGWEKVVQTGVGKVRVVLDPSQGRVSCAYLELVK